MSEMTRRNFVSASVAAGALAGLGAAAGLSAMPAPARASEVTWDEECEVLVISGGNSSVAAGDIAVCNSSVQEREGVEDSVDQYVNDMLVAGLYLNDEAKCCLIAEKSNETWEWSIEQGATWATNEDGDYFLYPYGGHTVKRSIAQVSGYGVTGPFTAKLEELGCPVETERMLTSLVLNDEGRVVGALVSDGATDNDASTGTPAAIHAKKAVVLATRRLWPRRQVPLGAGSSPRRLD